jgi:hypothetical protein
MRKSSIRKSRKSRKNMKSPRKTRKSRKNMKSPRKNNFKMESMVKKSDNEYTNDDIEELTSRLYMIKINNQKKNDDIDELISGLNKVKLRKYNKLRPDEKRTSPEELQQIVQEGFKLLKEYNFENAIEEAFDYVINDE